ncbi:olfactory receptor 1E1-like [Rhinatrema bivittatum]|uniref:olfactory receptor 1E1-like n=1 Tax=Rhinatrema bivittatum TaxID=194408 RepID=UPI001128C561|nr:olfactory receptor 1E1-like [Rhinatrema bivittatum]
MEQRNQTGVTEFLLLGLTEHAELSTPLFLIFLAMYLMNLLGNGTIISVISGNSQLHTPMYFFLCNLSFVDMSFSSVTVPNMLRNLITNKKTISFSECITQLYFFLVFTTTECVLLSIMAYDRYVAICNPLHYITIMSKKVCLSMSAASFIISFLNALLHTLLVYRLSFCNSNKIQHFFCDVTPLLHLSCTDTSINELVIFTEGSLIAILPFLIILISYVRIITTILKIQSTSGRHKTFSTCSSHLTVVMLFYGTLIFMYFRPSSSYSLEKDMITSVVYNVVSPMLNPFIYSLRNREVKAALRKTLQRKVFFSNKGLEMEQMNQTAVTEFLLLGLIEREELRGLLIVVFLAMYLMNLMGNGTIISVITGNSQLHTPMYFFLCNLSFVDMSFSSVTVPKMLSNLISDKKTISFSQCITQLYFFIVFGSTECILLSVMAYDRYVAICNPLHYITIMNKNVCLSMSAASFIISFLNSLLHTLLLYRLSFCNSNKIHHFFCDVPAMLQLSCTDTSINELVLFSEASLIIMLPFLIILISYIRIINTILKITSTGGRYNTFSTCSSHLTVVMLFYGTLIFMYFRPSSSYSLEKDLITSVVYNVVSPMLNPFIYSLRNRDVKMALRRVLWH